MTQTDSPETPQTALEVWTEQLTGLTDPTQADSAINTIYERLMKLHGNFLNNEMPKQAGQVEEAYNLALGIYQDLQQRQTLIAGGAAAIAESDRLRGEAVGNLQMLLDSIKSGDESHPALAQYAEEIRADEREDTLSDPYVFESVYEGAAEQADEALYDMIMEKWDVSYMDGDHVVGLLTGNLEATPEQRDLIEKLFASLPKPKADPLAAAFHNIGAFNPAPDEVDDDDDDE